MFAAIGSRKRMRRVAPSPPVQRPVPPEPRRIPNNSTMTGKRVYMTSGAVIRLLDMCVWSKLVPSKPEIGRTAGRGRGGKEEEISGGAGVLKNKPRKRKQ